MTDNTDPQGDHAAQQQLSLHRIYLRDASFEAPGGQQALANGHPPEINMQLTTNVQELGDDTFEVVLNVTVTAATEDKPVFLVEVQQAGLFGVTGFNPPEMGALLGSYCPNVLYAFAREAIADLVAKGGFPQLLLAPVNFDAMYAQHLQQQQVGAQGQAAH
ncbi:MAG: protein-export chaperone SecB [Chromatiales bacterium 21-64-14]|nr:MAG: protein-export chaperone SecB [Chromatiales bacterium 21-64-14]HQU14548.1 protein-export chaperone SecB [Gammaproteobacteria bacterium]